MEEELSESLLIIIKMLSACKKEIDVVRKEISIERSRVESSHDDNKRLHEQCRGYVEELKKLRRAPKED